MVRPQAPARISFEDRDESPLSSLARTLDSLEARLSRFPAKGQPRRPAEAAGVPMAAAAAPAAKPAALADAVSQIVMRRQMLDSMSDRNAAGRRDARPARSTERPENGSLIRRLEKLATDADNLHREDGTYRAMSEVADELQRLRDELYSGTRSTFESSFDELRGDFSQLRQMIGQRGGADAISAKLQAVSAALANLTEAGADRATLNSLRSELEEIRHVFRHMPVEPASRAVEEPWRAMESRYAAQMEENVLAKVELKTELERLRESLRSLAREDQFQAVEARWDALEKRLDADSVEASLEALTARMATIEAKLDELPNSLDRTALEDRIRALAENFETLLARGGVDPQQFVAMEERLDEISGAIVAIHDAAGVDALTIDRIENRIEALAGRVEEIAGEQNVDILSARVAELSARVEEMAKAEGVAGVELAQRVETLAERFEVALAEFEPREIDLAAIELRISGLAERFEAAIAEIEVPAVDTSAIEARLGALAARLEESAAEPRVDGEVVRSLEAQIERLSESLTRVGGMQEDFEADFEQRLQVMEQRLEEHREMLIDAAREIADETARRMQVFGEAKQAEHVLKLSESLHSLERLSRDSDGRSTQVFEAVHTTLIKIVDRLELIEAELSDGKETKAKDVAPAGPAQEVRAVAPMVELRSAAKNDEAVAPSAPVSLAERAREALAAVRPTEDQSAPLDPTDEIDREEMNRPLEPGSGTPDIGSLLERVRSAQRSRAQGLAQASDDAEMRAAALEAAKAASEEVGKLRAPSETELEAPGGLRGLLARRRKAIITCVVAVVVALSALPVGKIVMGDDQGASTLAALENLIAPKMVEDAPEGAASAPPVMTEMPTTSADAAPAAVAPVMQEPAVAALAETSKENTADAAMTTGGTPEAAPKLVTEPKPADDQASVPAANETPSAPVDAAAPVAPIVETAKTEAPAADTTTAEVPDEEVPAANVPATEAPSAVAEAAPADPVAPVSSTSLIDGVRGKLPVSARSLPPVPEGIGPAKLAEAARSGDAKAAFEIGLRMMEGRGGQPDPKAALDWFAQSALKGFAPAQYSIGTLYEKGNGVARDTETARDWYTLAADGGNVRAMHNLAVLYATGIDGRSQPEVAGRWFQQAAEHGMRDSQYNLGILYARGSGVPRDLVQSYKWFGIVADSGDADAAAKRDEVGRNLTQDQLRRGQEAVRAFAPETRNEGANTVDTPNEWQDRPEQTSAIDMTKAVRNIQAILGKLGYDAGAPDGKVGDKTRAAISAFQKDNKLAETGEIDGPLIRALLQRKNG